MTNLVSFSDKLSEQKLSLIFFSSSFLSLNSQRSLRSFINFNDLFELQEQASKTSLSKLLAI